MELRVGSYCKVHLRVVSSVSKSNFPGVRLSQGRSKLHEAIKTFRYFETDKIHHKIRLQRKNHLQISNISPPILSRQNSLSDYQFTNTVSNDLMQQKQKIRKVFWTPQEDALLKELALEYKSDWIQISKFIPNRNPSQCSQRWKRIKPIQAPRNKIWTKEEDQNLLDLVERHGKKWHLISKEVSFRTSIQVRERYLNHLDPQINKDPWTTEEDKKLWHLYLVHGSKWSLISREFQGRPAYMVKNRFYGHVRSSCGNQINPYYAYRISTGENSCEAQQIEGIAFSQKGVKKTTKKSSKAERCIHSQASWEDDLSKYFISVDSEQRSRSLLMQLSENSNESSLNKMAIQLEQTESNCKDLLIVSHDFQQSITQKADINESHLDWELNNSIFNSPGPTFD